MPAYPTSKPKLKRILGDALAVNFKELATKSISTTAIDNVEQRLNAKIDNVQQLPQRQKSTALNSGSMPRSTTLAAKVDGQFTLLKWMIGRPSPSALPC